MQGALVTAGAVTIALLAPSPAATASDGHAGLTDAEAVALAVETQPLLGSRLFPGLGVEAGEELSIRDSRTAVLEPEGPGAAVLVDAQDPIAVRDQGGLVPLSDRLIRDGDHYRAERPLTVAELPARLAEGIEIPSLGIVMKASDAGSVEGVPVAEKLVYPNAEPDTDYLLAPTPGGAELALALRSPSSPESFALDFELPAGASLKPADDSGVVIVDAGDAPIATVSGPIAFDAEGARVGVEFEERAGGVSIEVAHRGRGLAYPITVDPTISDYYPWADGPDAGYWSWASSFGAFSGFYNQAEHGMMNRATPATYSSGAYGQWVASSIRDSAIERVDFYNFDRRPTAPGACTQLGIWGADQSQWVWSSIFDPEKNETLAGQQATLCGNAAHDSRYLWAGSSPTPDGVGGDAESPDHTMAVFGLSSFAGKRVQAAENLLRSAMVYRSDLNLPKVISAPPSANWTKGVGQGFWLTDSGLGVSGLAVREQGATVASKSAGCSGGHASVCSASRALSVDLPQGRRNLQAVASDPVGNQSAPQGWMARVDRSPPQVVATAGTLKDEAENLLETQDYGLAISAIDGNPTIAAQNRSGVTSVELRADGKPITYYDPEAEADVTLIEKQSCPAIEGSCSMTADLTLPALSLEPGQHTITARATDALGHQAESSFVVTVRADPDEPEVELEAGEPDGQGAFKLQVSAKDGAPYDDPQKKPFGSGVAHVDVFFDGEKVESVDQLCLKGGCSVIKEVKIDQGVKHPEEHELVAIVYDRSGNGTVKRIGKQKSGFPRYGFNGFLETSDDPQTPENDVRVNLDRAVAGAGNIVRWPVSWCSLVNGLPVGAPPEQWHWGVTDAVFEQIRQINDDGKPGDLLSALPVLFVVPHVSNNVYDCGSAVVPSANDAPGYKQLVGAILDRYGPPHDDPDTPQPDSVGDDNFGLLGVEAWNEPNLPIFWTGETTSPKAWNGEDPTTFAALVNAAGEALLDRDLLDKVKLLPGGLSPDGKTPTTAVYAKQAFSQIKPKLVGAISLHLYANFASTAHAAGNKLLTDYEDLIDGVESSADGEDLLDKPRWITEIGFPSASIVRTQAARNSSERTQRQRLIEYFWRFAFKKKITALLVHTLADWSDVGGSEANNFGLWRAVPEGVVQCKDGVDNDLDGIADFDLDKNLNTPGDTDCTGEFDTWESSTPPTYSKKAVYCRLGTLAELQANPLTADGC